RRRGCPALPRPGARGAGRDGARPRGADDPRQHRLPEGPERGRRGRQARACLSPADPLATDRGFIDVNTVFGPEHGIGRAAGAPLSLLIEERRRHGIRAALTSSLVAATADPWGGDRLA